MLNVKPYYFLLEDQFHCYTLVRICQPLIFVLTKSI